LGSDDFHSARMDPAERLKNMGSDGFRPIIFPSDYEEVVRSKNKNPEGIYQFTNHQAKKIFGNCL